MKLGHQNYKMSLEYPVVQKQEKVLRIQKDEGMSKGQGTSMKGVPMARTVII